MCNIKYAAQGVGWCKKVVVWCCASNSQNGKRKQSRRARATYLAPSHVSLCHRPADKVTISK